MENVQRYWYFLHMSMQSVLINRSAHAQYIAEASAYATSSGSVQHDITCY